MNKLKPLDGIRIIDFTSMMAGPFLTRLLADCGAELIKIEALTGDYMRYRSPIRDGRSSYYGHMNCGKKSIAIDLKKDAGKAIAKKLIAKADVVVENFRPGVMHEMSLSYDNLKDEFPDLIFCSVSGFGQKSPRARDPAYAPIIHAASGLDLTHMRWNKHLDRPPNTGIFTADAVAGIYAFGAIQTALIHRMRHGGGQHVDVNLLDSALNLLVYEVQDAQFPSDNVRPLYEPLKTSDGFVMVAPVNQKNFENLADAIGCPHWKIDPKFSNNRAREKNWAELMRGVEKWTHLRTSKECEKILMNADVPSSRFVGVPELVNDPELRANGSFSQVSDGSGSYMVPSPPFKLSNADVEPANWVSDLSQDRKEILHHIAGYSMEEIQQLESDGTVGINSKLSFPP